MPRLQHLHYAHLVIALEALIWGLNTYALLAIYAFSLVTDALLNTLRIFIVGMAGDPMGRLVGFKNPLSALVLSIFVIGFFWSKFGVALLCSIAFILVIPGLLNGAEGSDIWIQTQAALSANSKLILVGCAVLFVSQLYDFIFGFLRHRQFLELRWWTLLLRPYFGLILTTIVLAVAVLIASQQQFTAPERALGLMIVAAKLSMDLWARRRDKAVGNLQTKSQE